MLITVSFFLSLVVPSIADGKNSNRLGTKLLGNSRIFSKTRTLDADSDQNDLVSCMKKTSKLYKNDDPFAILGDNPNAFGSTICETEDTTEYKCNLGGNNDYRKNSEKQCKNMGGKIIDQNVFKCSEKWCPEKGCADGETPPNVYFESVPICIANVCSDETDFISLLSVFSAMSNGEPLTVTGSCKPINIDSDTVSDDNSGTVTNNESGTATNNEPGDNSNVANDQSANDPDNGTNDSGGSSTAKGTNSDKSASQIRSLTGVILVASTAIIGMQSSVC